MNRHWPPGRKSIDAVVVVNPSGPHQRQRCSGVVNTSNTSSGEASTSCVGDDLTIGGAGQVVVEAPEALRPARLHSGERGRRLGDERDRRRSEVELGLAPSVDEVDRGDRLDELLPIRAHRGRFGDEPVWWGEFPVRAVDGEVYPVRATHHDAEQTALPRVGRRGSDTESLGSPPPREVFGLGERPEYKIRRRVQDPRELDSALIHRAAPFLEAPSGTRPDAPGVPPKRAGIPRASRLLGAAARARAGRAATAPAAFD